MAERELYYKVCYLNRRRCKRSERFTYLQDATWRANQLAEREGRDVWVMQIPGGPKPVYHVTGPLRMPDHELEGVSAGKITKGVQISSQRHPAKY